MAKTKRTFRKINKRKNNKSKRRVSKRNTRKIGGGKKHYFGTTLSDYIETRSRVSNIPEELRRVDEYFGIEKTKFIERYKRYKNLMKYIRENNKDPFDVIPYYGLKRWGVYFAFFNEGAGQKYGLNNQNYWGESEWTEDETPMTSPGRKTEEEPPIESRTDKNPPLPQMSGQKLQREEQIGGSLTPDELNLAKKEWLEIKEKEKKIGELYERKKKVNANITLSRIRYMEDIVNDIFGEENNIDKNELITRINNNVIGKQIIEEFNKRFADKETISYDEFYNSCLYGD